MKIKDVFIDTFNQNNNLNNSRNCNCETETIEEALSCGLVHTGEYEDGQPQFIGDNRAWSKFDNGEF
jgi:hypothetical protein